MPPPPRRRPDPDAVIKALYRARLPSSVTVVNVRPNDFLHKLPLVAARAIVATGTRMRHLRTLAEIDVQSHAEDRGAASDLDDRCYAALEDAARDGGVYAGALVGPLEVITFGAELRVGDQPGRLRTWQASYRLTIRPA